MDDRRAHEPQGHPAGRGQSRRCRADTAGIRRGAHRNRWWWRATASRHWTICSDAAPCGRDVRDLPALVLLDLNLPKLDVRSDSGDPRHTREPVPCRWWRDHEREPDEVEALYRSASTVHPEAGRLCAASSPRYARWRARLACVEPGPPSCQIVVLVGALAVATFASRLSGGARGCSRSYRRFLVPGGNNASARWNRSSWSQELVAALRRLPRWVWVNAVVRVSRSPVRGTILRAGTGTRFAFIESVVQIDRPHKCRCRSRRWHARIQPSHRDTRPGRAIPLQVDRAGTQARADQRRQRGIVHRR